MSLIVVTPSHAPDFAGFKDLHASVMRNTDATTRHIVVVPDEDCPLFSSVKSSRLIVRGYRSLLPRAIRPTTRLARLPRLPRGYRVAAINVRRPWPPLRGWILQQIVKMAVVRELDHDVALLIDSDVLVARPLMESKFRRDTAVRLYRLPNGLNAKMGRHFAWRRTAHELLRPPSDDPQSADYITPFATWSPEVLRQCLVRVEERSGMHWLDAVGRHLEFSEFILYGTFASTLATAGGTYASDLNLCHSYWTPEPMTRSAAERFMASMPAHALAVHIQSNSGTDEHVRRFVADAVGDG